MTLPSILVVEDEPAIADNIVYALRTEGYAPHWVATASAALQQFRSLRPALVILDVGLPDASGFDLCRQLRAEAPTPIIFLSARGGEIDRVLGLELGGDDYMVKPFSPRELTARVRARLRSHITAAATPAPVFELDTDAQRIHWQGRALDLTRYEYRLFALLLTQPGRVYNREQLLAHAWEDPTGVFDRTVDTHVKTLRQKIRDVANGLDPIRTVRGVGYAYEPLLA